MKIFVRIIADVGGDMGLRAGIITRKIIPCPSKA